jgi:hypothetical protein
LVLFSIWHPISVEYNGTNRTVWYDDVATAPSRIGCLK